MKTAARCLCFVALFAVRCPRAFGSVEPLVDGVFEDLLAGFPAIEGSVLRHRGDGVRISVGRSQGATHGMVFRVLRDRGKLKDPDTGEVAGRDLQPVGWIRTVRLFERTAMAEVLEGRADKGDRITTELVAWPMEVDSILFEGEKDTPLGEAIQDLLEEKLERTGRFVLDSEDDSTLPGYRLEGELLDTTGALGITLKLIRVPQGRVVRLLTRQVPMTASLRRLLGSPLDSPTPYVSVVRLALDRRNVCDLAAVPLPGRQWVALLTAEGIDMIRFRGERLEVLPGLQFAQSLDGVTGLGHLLARGGEGQDAVQILFRTEGIETEELRLKLADRWFHFVSAEAFPLLWLNAAPVQGRLVEGRNFFSKETGAVVSPEEFVDMTRARLFGTEEESFCAVGADDVLYVFDEAGTLLWRGDKPCGARIAARDWDGNGVAEIACTSATPLGTVDELRLLEWNGEVFWEKWRSGTIQGSIMGLAGADLDGDGRDELVVAIEGAPASGEACGLQVFRATGALGRTWD